MTHRRAIWAAVTLASGAVFVLVGAPQQPPASASTTHRAAVVVDLGDGHVRVGCVSFTEDHISGLEALDRASMAPVAQTFSGQGSAVCALCGKGCAAGSTCLTCQAPNYWAYYHDGVYSRSAASSTQVRDGDTEGWRWGKGEAPALVPFSQVCPAKVPTPTVAPTTRPVTTVPPTRPFTPPTSAHGGAGTTGPPGGAVLPGVMEPSASTVPGAAGSKSTTSTVPPPGPRATGRSGSTAPGATGTTQAPSKRRDKPSTKSGSPSGEETAAGQPRDVVVERAGDSHPATTDQGGDGSGSVLSIAGFVAAIAVVGALIVVVRRRRVVP